MKIRSLAEVLVLYEAFLKQEYDAKPAKEIFEQTLTALSRYTLRGWGGPYPQGRKPTKAETDAAQMFIEGVLLHQLKSALNVQAKVFEELQVKPSSRYTYGSRLKKLLDWVQQQDWWPYKEEAKLRKNRSRKHWHGHGNATIKHVTKRIRLKPYSLRADETPPTLKYQLDEFYKFLTQERYPQRQGNPIKSNVAKGYIIYLRRILGWFYRSARPIYNGNTIVDFSDDPNVSHPLLEQLSLNLLVPKVQLKYAHSKDLALKEAEQAAEYVDIWLCKFLNFFEEDRRSRSWQSMQVTISSIHALVRFQYHKETADCKYKDIPVMAVVTKHLALLRKRKKHHKPVSDVSKQWLDLPDVWQKIVRALREECSYRSSDGHLRSHTALAHSFQLFIIWACLTFRPPRRQQEFRELKMALSCPIDPPEGLKPGQVIHPLPVDREEDKDHGYLFKDLDGLWYMDMTPESYKTGATYGHQEPKIPNEPLADGKCFYDYLEAFLYGYYRDEQGNWISGGQFVDDAAREGGRWFSLRMHFNPTHNHVFTKPHAATPYTPGGFSSLMRTSSHRLTGKLLYPHLLRDIFATWFLDQGYTPDRIASLAYAMAHSEKTLREIYDKRRPKDKNRPIEEVMSGLVQQYMS